MCLADVLVLSAGTYGNVIRVLSPLVITDEQLDRGLSVLAEEITTRLNDSFETTDLFDEPTPLKGTRPATCQVRTIDYDTICHCWTAALRLRSEGQPAALAGAGSTI